MTDRGKRIIIIAGPNGAGKSTFAREFLPNEAKCPVFVASHELGCEIMKTSLSANQKARIPGVEAALNRSARRAREIAARTGTPLVVLKDGRIERQALSPITGKISREDSL